MYLGILVGYRQGVLCSFFVGGLQVRLCLGQVEFCLGQPRLTRLQIRLSVG